MKNQDFERIRQSLDYESKIAFDNMVKFIYKMPHDDNYFLTTFKDFSLPDGELEVTEECDDIVFPAIYTEDGKQYETELRLCIIDDKIVNLSCICCQQIFYDTPLPNVYTPNSKRRESAYLGLKIDVATKDVIAQIVFDPDKTTDILTIEKSQVYSSGKARNSIPEFMDNQYPRHVKGSRDVTTTTYNLNRSGDVTKATFLHQFITAALLDSTEYVLNAKLGGYRVTRTEEGKSNSRYDVPRYSVSHDIDMQLAPYRTFGFIHDIFSKSCKPRDLPKLVSPKQRREYKEKARAEVKKIVHIAETTKSGREKENNKKKGNGFVGAKERRKKEARKKAMREDDSVAWREKGHYVGAIEHAKQKKKQRKEQTPANNHQLGRSLRSKRPPQVDDDEPIIARRQWEHSADEFRKKTVGQPAKKEQKNEETEGTTPGVI